MTKKQQIYLSVLSGLLLIPAWYSWGSGLFLLFALVPLLFVEEFLVKTKFKSLRFFWIPFLAFFIFNISTLWWIKNASFPGMLVAVVLNTFLMSFAFWLFTVTHRKLGDGFGYFSFLFFWIAYEYLYLNGEISFTWLNLGNGFANDIKLIQWYEYTGVFGGTAWVLISNVLLFKIIKSFTQMKKLMPAIFETILFLFVLLFPITFSLITYYSYKEKNDPYEIVVLQPNIDPYQKFNDIPPYEQMTILLNLADSLTGPETDYVVAPETFINDNLWLDRINKNSSIQRIIEFIEKNPGVKFIVGATTYKAYDSEEEATPTARPFRGTSYYDSFNTALQIDSTGIVQIYHKSQLVVGVEKMPYTQYLGFLEDLMLHLGGTFRSHGTQEHRATLISPEDSVKIAPVICYESIFGEFVTEYITEADANFIFVITNDGWWGKTPGYIQHNSFSSLRAIETRRSIARSANTGISSFIDQRGEILKDIGWWKRSAIKNTLDANNEITFYVKHGDFIGRISVFVSIFILLYTLVRFSMNKVTFRKTKTENQS